MESKKFISIKDALETCYLEMNNAEKDSTFIFLSNIENITFDQAWKAAGFSSNMEDYFDVEVAKFVGMK